MLAHVPLEVRIYLAVHSAQTAFLNNEVTGRLQEVGAKVTLLDVIVLIAAVSGPGPGPVRHTQDNTKGLKSKLWINEMFWRLKNFLFSFADF